MATRPPQSLVRVFASTYRSGVAGVVLCESGAAPASQNVLTAVMLATTTRTPDNAFDTRPVVAAVRLHRVNVVTAGTCLFFLAFAVTRAARVPLTYDEAASYIRYIDTTVPSVFDTTLFSIFNFEVATNHFLNTLLMKICWMIGGGSEIVLRAPNLAAYAMFMGFSLLILRAHTRPFIALAGFVLLNLNPYVVEYFSLSRGYGLSLACLMGSIFYLLRFLKGSPHRDSASRDASRALAFACAAVMANFALLHVYLAVFAVIVAGTAVFTSRASDIPSGGDGVERAAPSLWLPIAAGVAFSTLVLSQDVGLSGTLYKPVAVTLVGLGQTELEHARVMRLDVRGRDRPLVRDAGMATWRCGAAPVRDVRVELLVADAARLAGIELVAGNRVFWSGPNLSGWNSHEAGGERVFDADASLSLPKSRLREFQSLMNWAGDTRYALSLATYAACVLAALAAFAALLQLVDRRLVRARVPMVDHWRTLGASALWVAALAGTPLYLLKRNSELYFGGTEGLIADTFYSLIDRSFHGTTYHPTQTPIVFAGIVATVAAFSVMLYIGVARGKLSIMLPPVCLMALIVISSLSEILQRFGFQTPYLTERAGLFYIPLYVLFVALSCQALTQLADAGRTIVALLLMAAIALSAFHFAATANITYASDWSADASTKLMMEDLQTVAAAERPPGSRVVLGVEPRYAAVAAYYARRSTAANIDIVPLSAPGIAFLYVNEDRIVARMSVIRRYAATHTALARAGAAR